MQSNDNVDIPAYLKWCEEFGLIPCSPSEFLAALKLAAPNELPYRDPTGLIWLHDINKKGACRTLADTIFGRRGTQK